MTTTTQTMNSYQTAVDALKECVTAAMNSDVDASTQGEIWRHYQGMKAIEKMVSRSTKDYKFSTDLDSISISSTYYDQLTDNVQAAGPVDVGLGCLGQGTDVISFG
ncbi:hypothetical protein Sn110110_196 [Cyanophage S-RIM14]|uniref:Uncharacterized protein n=1 Tax=Cyanophage S-RIM14 TaxID=1278423 RepID=A0A1D7SLF9_9CAUD|nr:hypothetical protein Sn110110_196 [Cyanophage S-RIM14]